MTLEKAKEKLEEMYTHALCKAWVIDPVAYALFEVWKEADIDAVKKKRGHKTDENTQGESMC